MATVKEMQRIERGREALEKAGYKIERGEVWAVHCPRPAMSDAEEASLKDMLLDGRVPCDMTYGPPLSAAEEEAVHKAEATKSKPRRKSK